MKVAMIIMMIIMVILMIIMTKMTKKTYNCCEVWVKKCYGMGRPPPPYSGNARKKTFFSIEAFPKRANNAGVEDKIYGWASRFQK